MVEKKQETMPAGAESGSTARVRRTAGAGGDAKPRSRADGAGAANGGNGEQVLKTGRGSPNSATPTKKSDLRKDLRDFASARPNGWDHDDWLSFLESLESRGHNVNDREAIGVALERERLDVALRGLKGVSAQRRNALVERFGTLWKLRGAEVDEIAAWGIPRDLAVRIKSELG